MKHNFVRWLTAYMTPPYALYTPNQHKLTKTLFLIHFVSLCVCVCKGVLGGVGGNEETGDMAQALLCNSHDRQAPLNAAFEEAVARAKWNTFVSIYF